MRHRILLLSVVAAICLPVSCIVSDQLTTLTILPDGSADWVRFQSSLRSTEEGEKGAEELRRFVEDFDAQRDADFVRIRESGGQILEARWVRRQEPYATLVVARLPSAKTLQDFCTLRNEKGETVIRTSFQEEGARRRLTFAVRLPKGDSPPAVRTSTEAEKRQEEANGISVTRLVVSGGRILDSRGFTVAGDRRSALINPIGIQAMLETGGGQADLFLEWQITAR